MLTRDSMIFVGQGREELHPLANSAILHHLFSYLDVKSLKSVRCTCTLWEEEANAFLQNKTKITITWHDKNDKKKIPTLATFMKYVESVTPEKVFFRNYTLQDWRLHSLEIETTQFWLQCGQHVRSLTLFGERTFYLYEESYVRNVFYHWTPNMESLEIMGDVRFVHKPNYRPFDSPENPKATKRVRYYDSDGDFESTDETDSEAENSDNSDDCWDKPMSKFEIQENIQPNYKFHSLYIDHDHDANECCNLPLPWRELFMAYPNIKNLFVLPDFPNDDIHNIGELLTDLIDFSEENPDKLHKLKNLDIFSRLNDGGVGVTNEHFEQAMKLKFNLESLDMWCDDIKDLSLSTIEKYVVKLSPSLKRLEIRSNSKNMKIFPPLAFRKITAFPNLTFLSIELCVLISNNVEFLQNTPKLKTLKIGDLPDLPMNGDVRLFVNTITLEPLATLCHLNVGYDILTEECVQKIGTWFPNLSEFGAILDDKLMWTVYRFLYNSVHTLNIMGKDLSDAGITGIPVRELEKSTESEASSSSKSELQDPPAKKRRNDEVGIGLMKKLQRIKIEDYNSSDKYVQLTDDAVYSGFIQVTELKKLDLLDCREAISEEAFRDLCDGQNVITLTASDYIRGPAGPVRRNPLDHDHDTLTETESQGDESSGAE